ncbi:hypothetical protein MPSEU_000760500 [Mayamaea pseudoterrestris]|nr:hypothetical protein MPSEU_000760500 [Mayamaea pseudoterrestris]
MNVTARSRRRRRNHGACLFAIMAAALLQPQAVCGFTSISPLIHYRGSFTIQQRSSIVCPIQSPKARGTLSTTSLNMFMGSDGGILGIGGPELFTILLVGYFILGPSDLYKVVKEIGKFVQNVRSFSTDLTKTFENNMEDQLQINEIRKAQQELTDAFSFRRTINVDQEEDAFSTTVTSPRGESPVEAVAAVGASGKKIVRRKAKRKVLLEEEENSSSELDGRVPDLEMPMASSAGENVAETVLASVSENISAATPPVLGNDSTLSPEEQAIIDQEFEQYTSGTGMSDASNPWLNGNGSESTSSSSMTQLQQESDDNSDTAAATSRFQQQLNGNWNNQVLANQDKLEPLAVVMQQIALLQEEKLAAQTRLQQEFDRREQLEQDYYEQQKQLLEEAMRQVQAQVQNVNVSTGSSAAKSES